MKKILISSLFFLSSLSAEITDSIIPFLNELETGKTLSSKKYSTSQYQEILATLQHTDQKIRIVSYNMLFDLYDNKLAPENRWLSRLPRLIAAVDTFQADILCIQELQPNQLDALEKKLSNDFSFVFDRNALQGIENGSSKDLDGILYRKKRFSLLETKTLPIYYSKKKTLITMAFLEDKKTQKAVRVFNSHFPFSSPDDREQTAREIAKIILPYAEKEAVILTGDMNTFANRPDLQKLPFYDGDRIELILSEGKIVDSMKKSILGHIGPISTFTNIGENPEPFKGTGTPGIILDHIFVSNSLQVIIHAIDPVRVDGHYSSDHMPVLIDVLQK